MAGCNEANCICPWHACVRHGKCCECIIHHRITGHPTNCMQYIMEEAVQTALDAKAEKTEKVAT